MTVFYIVKQWPVTTGVPALSQGALFPPGTHTPPVTPHPGSTCWGALLPAPWLPGWEEWDLPRWARVSLSHVRPGLDSGAQGPVIYCLPGQQVARVFLVSGAFRRRVG